METDEQQIRARAIIEVVGKPKEYIENKIKEYVEKIKEDETFIVLNEKIEEAREQGKVWSTIAEIEIVAKGITNLVGFCIDYMPSSVEVIKPEKFTFVDRDFTSFINDMIAKLHRVDMIAKQLSTDNNVLKKNMNNLIKNNLLVLIRFGITELDKIAKATGIEEKEVKKFLDILIDEKRIEEKEGVYKIR